MRFWIAGPILAFSLCIAGAGAATPGQDMVTASLGEQGFEVTLVHWTWLGRIRIIAVSADIRREIVINPNTGEILRDYSQALVAEAEIQNGGQDGSDTSTASVARSSGDVDASAMDALQEMSMGLAGPMVVEPGQE